MFPGMLSSQCHSDNVSKLRRNDVQLRWSLCWSSVSRIAVLIIAAMDYETKGMSTTEGAPEPDETRPSFTAPGACDDAPVSEALAARRFREKEGGKGANCTGANVEPDDGNPTSGASGDGGWFQRP